MTIYKKIFVTFSFVLILVLCIYIPKSPFVKKPYIRIPLKFIPDSNISVINIEIEKKIYPLYIDLGASGACIFLRNDLLQKIHHKELQTSELWISDINRNRYKHSLYNIPTARMENYEQKNPSITEENYEFLIFGTNLWNPPHDIDNLRIDDISQLRRHIIRFTRGTVGHEFFRGKNLFFDYIHSALFIINDFEVWKKKNPMDHFIEVPLEVTPNGIVISMEIDIGIKKFLLDTGSNVSILRDSLADAEHSQEVAPGRWVFISNKFGMGTTNFGDYGFCHADIPVSSGDIDGILGSNFFSHPLYLDVEKKKAFIGPPPPRKDNKIAL